MEGSSSSSLWAFVNDAVAEDRSALNRLLLLVPTASEVALFEEKKPHIYPACFRLMLRADPSLQAR